MRLGGLRNRDWLCLGLAGPGLATSVIALRLSFFGGECFTFCGGFFLVYASFGLSLSRFDNVLSMRVLDRGL